MTRQTGSRRGRTGLVLQLLLTLLISVPPVSGQEAVLGVNLGLNGDTFPNVSTIIHLLKSLHAGAVRLYDADPSILGALGNTGLQVIVSVPNDELASIAEDESSALAWVKTFVAAFYPATAITHIALGNEVLHEGTVETEGQYLIPAMWNIYHSLASLGLHRSIKVISPLSGEILGSSWPPMASSFHQEQYVFPLLEFLQETGSTFFINLYPYYAHIGNSIGVPLEYATFQARTPAFVDPLSLLPYFNLFEAMLDATYSAMVNLGFPDVPLAVGETGWPTAGAHPATVQNAQAFNQNLLRYVLNRGTPLRPDVRTSVFIFALFNENLKPGPETEKHWGLFNADGTPVYPMDLQVVTV